MKTLAIATAAIGLAVSSTPAIAGDGSQSMAVKYSDLNLSTADGQKQLDRRINAAAKKVCRVHQAQTGTRIQSRNAQKCYQLARAKARTAFASVIEENRRGG